jgi:HAD superfamily hydrolase (TIGR01509 family)
MDGVLIDARNWHYEALNEALSPFGFNINEELHLSKLDGLPTKVKLNYLTDNFNLPKSIHDLIFNLKQDLTNRLASYNCKPNVQHLEMLSNLKAFDIKVGVVTNSIRRTSQLMLDLAGITSYVDLLVTNEDVERNKPFPDPYLKALDILKLKSEDVLVIEDSQHGIEAAVNAKCRVLEVRNPTDLGWNLLSGSL